MIPGLSSALSLFLSPNFAPELCAHPIALRRRLSKTIELQDDASVVLLRCPTHPMARKKKTALGAAAPVTSSSPARLARRVVELGKTGKRSKRKQ